MNPFKLPVVKFVLEPAQRSAMDHCYQHLNRLINELPTPENNERSLIWLDDNFGNGDIQFDKVKEHALVITNRIDTVDLLKAESVNVQLSDFKLSSTEKKFLNIFYRVSKERFVSHRCINQSISALKKKGQLVLVGRKEDGIKTYFDKCVKELGLEGSIKKHRDCYICHLSITSHRPENRLNDGDYKTIRDTYKLNISNANYTMYSKPGVYGWKKADAGTQFLIDTVSPLIPSPSKEQNALDLGCGSGHLSLALHAFGFHNITATDNNAAAIAAVTRTHQENKVKATVVTSDTGNSIKDKFDLILCNPPFHKGFETNAELTEKFVHACRRLLTPHGSAYFVTNAFIGIEKEIFNAGLSGKQIDNNKQFKVLKIKLR